MSSIRILPPGLQNQIAAGEVVERPSSVVKELMENSLDAGSGNIQAYLESGGQRLIEVIDDGHGMKPDDLPLALTRHATSKISSIDELVCVSSFGFRGEALPSIASISQLTISSCPEGWDQGFFLKLIYGKMVEQGPVAMNPGTRIRVENLLANVPARLKFLKTRATESRKCTESFIRYCLAHLNVDFELFSESRSIYRFFQGQSLLDRLNIVWPAQVCESLKEFSGEQSGMSIHGLASDPKSTQPRADRLLFYINKRPVSDRMLLSAVRQAYKGRLLSREYPQAAVFIELPPDEVDINVHPAKNQVRFRDEKTVFSLVVRALKPVMGNDIYQSSYEETSTVENTGSHSSLSYTQQSEGQEKTFHRLKEKRSGFSYAGRAPAPSQNQIHQADKQSISIRGLVYLGQVQKSFLIFRKSDSTLIIVDQHAAHERIMLEKIQNGLKKTVVKGWPCLKDLCSTVLKWNICKPCGRT